MFINDVKEFIGYYIVIVKEEEVDDKYRDIIY